MFTLMRIGLTMSIRKLHIEQFDQVFECEHVLSIKPNQKKPNHLSFHRFLCQNKSWRHEQSSYQFGHGVHRLIGVLGKINQMNHEYHWVFLFSLTLLFIRVPPPGRSTKGQKVSWQVINYLEFLCMLFLLFSTSSFRALELVLKFTIIRIRWKLLVKMLIVHQFINRWSFQVVQLLNMKLWWKIFKYMKNVFRDWSMVLACWKNE